MGLQVVINPVQNCLTGFAAQFGLRADIIRTALVSQMQLVDQKIKDCKAKLEDALTQDQLTEELISELEGINKGFKDEMRHATMHLPKPKSKAKAKSQAK